jgi:hypothetical protein
MDPVRTDVSEKEIASIFRAKDSESIWYILPAKQRNPESLSSLSAVRYSLAANQCDSEYFTLKMEAMFLRNVSAYKTHTASAYPRREHSYFYHVKTQTLTML